MPPRSKSSPAAEPMWMQDLPAIGGPEDRLGLDTDRFLSPATVMAVLQGANSGDPVEHRNFHLIMRRTWPALRNALEQVRNSANECDWQTSPAVDDDGKTTPESERRQAVVDAALFKSAPRQGYLEASFADWLANAAEATLYAPTAYEMLWGMEDRGQGMQAVITGFKTLPPSWTVWRDVAGAEDAFLFRRGGRLGSRRGEEWPADQFVVQMPGTLDHPSLSAILDTLALWWVAAAHAPKWLITYVQKYGTPFMWANFAAGNKADRDAAIAALRTLGHAGYGAFPTGTNFQISQPTQSGDLPQESLVKLADSVCLQTILGSDLTTKTSGTGSLALGEVHQDNKSRRERAILATVCTLVNEQIIPAILRQTFGDARLAPVFSHGDGDEQDLKETADLLKAARELGLPVGKGYVYEVLGIPKPGDGEEVLEGGKESAGDGEPGKGPPPADGPEDDPEDDSAAAAARAAAADMPATPEDFVDDLAGLFVTVMESAAATGSRLMEADKKTLIKTENA